MCWATIKKRLPPFYVIKCLVAPVQVLPLRYYLTSCTFAIDVIMSMRADVNAEVLRLMLLHSLGAV